MFFVFFLKVFLSKVFFFKRGLFFPKDPFFQNMFSQSLFFNGVHVFFFFFHRGLGSFFFEKVLFFFNRRGLNFCKGCFFFFSKKKVLLFPQDWNVFRKGDRFSVF